jgi:hypothetical protein
MAIAVDKPAVFAAPGQPGSLVKLKSRYENFIGGEWVAPSGGECRPNLTPVTAEPFCEVAEQRGITRFVAEVLCENRAMLDVFGEGFDAHVVCQEGMEERVEFLTFGWRLAYERFSQGAPSAAR